MYGIIKLYKIYAGCVKLFVLNSRGNFHLKFFRRFKDIAVFVVGSLILPHPAVACLRGGPYIFYHTLFRGGAGNQ